MSLRADLIETIRDALFAEDPAEAALDAALGYLSTNTEAWAADLEGKWITEETTYANVLRGRIAVLQDDQTT